MEAISHAGTVLGVLAKDGVVLAAEKKVTGKLLDLSGAKEGGYGGSGEKIFLLNSCVKFDYPRYPCSKLQVRQKCDSRRCRHYSRCELACQLCAAGCAETFILVQ